MNERQTAGDDTSELESRLSAESVPPSPVAIRIEVRDLRDAVIASSIARRWALERGLARVRASEVALVVSELCTNIAKYAGSGDLSLDEDSPDGSLWIVARDRGPGLTDVGAYFTDGHSRGRERTVDTPARLGLGFGGGAVRRLSDEVVLLPRLGGGMEVRCRFETRGPTAHD